MAEVIRWPIVTVVFGTIVGRPLIENAGGE